MKNLIQRLEEARKSIGLTIKKGDRVWNKKRGGGVVLKALIDDHGFVKMDVKWDDGRTTRDASDSVNGSPIVYE